MRRRVNVIHYPTKLVEYSFWCPVKPKIDKHIVGFAIADLKENNIWALFLDPEFEGKGIGQLLHNTMLDWYFSQTKTTVWLGTGFNTRAEKFYRKAGWTEVGTHGPKEIKFEMTYDDWVKIRNQ